MIFNYVETEGGKSVTIRVKHPALRTKVLMCKDDSPNEDEIIGYVKCRNKEVTVEDDSDARLLKLPTENSHYTINVLEKASGHFIQGWLCTDCGYIGVLRPFPVILFLLIFLLLVLIVGIGHFYVDVSHRNIADTADSITNVQQAVENGSIKFAGYSDVDSTPGMPVYLENPDTNDVWFTYTITRNDTGDVILPETGLIAPGTFYEWDASQSLERGKYSCTFLVRTFDMGDDTIEYTPAVMDSVKLTIY